MLSLGTIRPEFQETTVIIEISNFGIFQYAKFHANKKELNMGPQTLYFGVFGLEFEKTSVTKLLNNNNNNKKVKLPSLVIFELEFEKTIVLFEIRNLEFVNIIFMKSKKNLGLGLKLPYFGTFKLELENKTIAIFEINTSNC